MVCSWVVQGFEISQQFNQLQGKLLKSYPQILLCLDLRVILDCELDSQLKRKKKEKRKENF